MFDVYLVNKNVDFYSRLKRGLDFLLSLLSLIVVIPIIIIFSVLIVIESSGNPFYFQKRVGLMGKEFNLIKLRSMRLDAEKNGAQWAKKNDDRITKIGKFIRKTRIDELPQVFNILKGDMAIIGPRPERKVFIEEFIKTIPDFPKRLEIKPGLTGWAQINGGYELSPDEKLKLDLYYIKNKNWILDIFIIIKTAKIVFTGEGSR